MHQSDYMSGKVKKVEILKNEAQSQARIFWQNLMFWAPTFFQAALENFLWGLRQRSRYLGRSLDIGLSSARRMMVIRHVEVPHICFIYIFWFTSPQLLHLRITTFTYKYVYLLARPDCWSICSKWRFLEGIDMFCEFN